MRHILTKKAFGIALSIETVLLLGAAYELYGRKYYVDVLEEVAKFYANILEKNDIELSDFDLIALNTIFEKADLLHVAIGED